MQQTLERLLRGESLIEEQEEGKVTNSQAEEQHRLHENKEAQSLNEEQLEILKTSTEEEKETKTEEEATAHEENIESGEHNDGSGTPQEQRENNITKDEEDAEQSKQKNPADADEKDKSTAQTTDSEEEQRVRHHKTKRKKRSKRRRASLSVHQIQHPLNDLDDWIETCAALSRRSRRTSDPAEPQIENELWKVTQSLESILAELVRKPFEEEYIPDVGKDKKLKIIHHKLKSIAESMKTQMARQSRFNFFGLYTFSVSPNKLH